ncbi:hypothetical protein [Mesorhizobium sp. IMUNJ 23232]|uniref:hypothetical protein n=1 Tax=Mesorhizobium sp. IMUNJ 23232 TaxID=3376064 RepID=UPI0037907D02
MPASLAVLTLDLSRLRDFVFKRGASARLRISSAGPREKHAHDVTITRESPNYPGGM